MPIRHDIELLRICGAFGIVWYHSVPFGNEVAYSGVVVFVVISIVLNGQSSTNLKLERLTRRLIIPWLAWFIIYLTGKSFFGIPIFSGSHYSILTILSGPNIHLWFIPFIYLSVIVFRYTRIALGESPLTIASSIFGGGMLLSSGNWQEWSMTIDSPLPQFIHALPAVFLGVLVNNAKNYRPPLKLVVLLVVPVCSLAALPQYGVGLTYFIGSILTLSLCFSGGWINKIWNVRRFSRLSFGIYLAHPLFILIALKTQLASGVVLAFVVFFASAIAIHLVQRLAPKRSFWIC